MRQKFLRWFWLWPVKTAANRSDTVFLTLQFFVFYYGAVQAVDSAAVNNYGGVFFTSRLETNFIVRLKEHPFEGCLVRHYETDEAIVAVVDLHRRRKNHYVAFAELCLKQTGIPLYNRHQNQARNKRYQNMRRLGRDPAEFVFFI